MNFYMETLYRAAATTHINGIRSMDLNEAHCFLLFLEDHRKWTQQHIHNLEAKAREALRDLPAAA